MNINKDFYAKLSTSCLTQLFNIYICLFLFLFLEACRTANVVRSLKIRKFISMYILVELIFVWGLFTPTKEVSVSNSRREWKTRFIDSATRNRTELKIVER